MTTEEIILDCSGTQKEGDVTGDDRDLKQKKIKYDFQVMRVDCRVKFKFTQESAGGNQYAVLKLKCGPIKKIEVPTLTLWKCSSGKSLETTFTLEPDGHAIWKKKNAGNFPFQNLYLYLYLKVLTSHDIYIFQVIMWLCTTTSLLAVKWNTKK